MEMEIKKGSLFLILTLFFINIANSIGGPPLLPDHFKGNVLINNEDAPIGTEIKVYVNDVIESTNEITILGEYDLYVKTGGFGNGVKLLVNNIEAATSERQGGATINLDLEINATLVGDKDNVNNNYDNLLIKIDGSETLNETMTGTKFVGFYDTDKKLVSFEFDFDNKNLNLFNIEIKKQSDSVGSILVKGIPSGVIKTVYVDRLTDSNNAVCIKDAEISSISEVSSDCTGVNEYKVSCPSTSGDYTCSLEDDRFKIMGLSHSGVKEFYIAPSSSNPPPSGSSSGGSSGGGGGGGGSGGGSKLGSCIENWECNGWFNCAEPGIQRRICTDKNNCGTASDKPAETQECEYKKEEITSEGIGKDIEESAETEGKKGISGITGAFIGFKDRTSTIVTITFITMVILLALVLNFRNIKKLFNKGKSF